MSNLSKRKLVMKKIDLFNKELVNTFTYTTISRDREVCTDVMIDGRMYTKYGKLQSITIVGNLYQDEEGNRMLLCGIARQHPCDARNDKKVAYEVAQERAVSNPDIVFNTVPNHITRYNFQRMMEWYVDGMDDLEFIRTKEEIKKNGLDIKSYSR